MPHAHPSRVRRRRFFLTSLGGLLLRGTGTLIGVALLAGLVGELWLRPGPLFRCVEIGNQGIVPPFNAADMDGDGRLEWLLATANPDHGASLVVRHLPGEQETARGDHQYFLRGSAFTGRVETARGRDGDVHVFTTSSTPAGVVLSRLRFHEGSVAARWDSLLFDGSHAPLGPSIQPGLVSAPRLLPDSTRFLLSLFSNFQGWRGGVVVDPDRPRELALLPAGTGMPLVDELPLRDARGRQRLLAAAGAANNGNTLGGLEDRSAILLLVDADSGIVHTKRLAGHKNVRARVFPDQRHVLLLALDPYDTTQALPNLLVWDSWGDSLVQQVVGDAPKQDLPRHQGGILWFDSQGWVRRAQVHDLGSSRLYRLHPVLDGNTKAVGGYWWRSAPDGVSELRRQADHRLVARCQLGSRGSEVWIEESEGRPRRLHGVKGHARLDTAVALDLRPLPFLWRWLAHPFLPWSLIPGSLAFLLLLGVRMFIQENLLRRLVPRQGQAVALLDAQGRLVYENEVFEEILRANHQRLPLPLPGNGEAERETRHGERRLRWRWRKVPRRLGRPWWHLVGEDVTHQRENEQQRLFLMKLAVMAHDLKAPLTPIRLQAELLGDALPLLPEAEAVRARRALGEIDRQVERSLQLITRFMGMARTEFECGPVALPDLARAALRDLAEQGWPALETSLEADPAATYVALAEGEVLQLALFELLQNAAQAVAGRGLLAVRLVKDGERVALVVRDSGPGIPPADLERVLEPGFTTRARGTGFGLYFVSRVLERMGGRLGLANRPEGGLEVRLELPAAIGPA